MAELFVSPGFHCTWTKIKSAPFWSRNHLLLTSEKPGISKWWSWNCLAIIKLAHQGCGVFLEKDHSINFSSVVDCFGTKWSLLHFKTNRDLMIQVTANPHDLSFICREVMNNKQWRWNTPLFPPFKYFLIIFYILAIFFSVLV